MTWRFQCDAELKTSLIEVNFCKLLSHMIVLPLILYLLIVSKAVRTYSVNLIFIYYMFSFRISKREPHL